LGDLALASAWLNLQHDALTMAVERDGFAATLTGDRRTGHSGAASFFCDASERDDRVQTTAPPFDLRNPRSAPN
jgi:hypothetical protein